MKALKFLLVAAVVVAASLAVACGGDDEPAAGSSGPGGAGGEVVVPGGGGMIVPNTFLTFNGQRYELVNMLQEDFVSESEFQQVGEASEADIDLRGDARVFTRNGDGGSVYTYSAPTADDIGFWLAWRLVS